MGKALHRLTAREVASFAKPGRYGDGGGLALIVGKGGQRSWTLRYRVNGQMRETGLGPASGPHKDGLSLAEARNKAAELRALIRAGTDPLGAKSTIPTFGEFADQHVESIVGGFRNQKHCDQWRMTLKVYCEPLRSVPIDEVSVEHVLAVLKPIWHSKPETASRVRGRIERVLAAAKVRGLRSGENPAAWRDNLKELLPKRKVLARGHFAALPYAEVPALMAELRRRKSISSLALQFAILTVARTGEVIGAQWPEINWDEKVWIVPGARMKAGRPHRVPLVDRAIEILKSTLPAQSPWCFPALKLDRPLSQMAMLEMIRGIRPGFTVHGLRSSFRDWCGDSTSFPREVAEGALAHVVKDKTEAAYRRGDALAKRRELLEAWARFVC